MFVCIVSDIQGLLRRVEVSGTIEGDDLVIGAQTLKRVSYIRQNLSAREPLQFLCLRYGKAGACNLPWLRSKIGSWICPKRDMSLV